LVINKLISGLPYKWEVASGPAQFSALFIEADDRTGRALSVQRIFEVES